MNGRRRLMIIALLGFLFYLPGLWSETGITTKDEYLLSLRTPIEMIEEGHFVTPYLDHEPRLKKAPLLYWLMYSSYRLFGINLFSARIWGVLGAIGLAATTGGIFRRLKLVGSPLVPALLVLSCAGVAIQARMALLDLPLAFLATLSVYLFLVWKEREGTVWLAGAGAACGLSALLKGPVGPVVAASAVALNLILAGGRTVSARRWKDWLAAAAVFLLVSVPWVLAMYLIWKETFMAEVYNELVKARFLTQQSTGPEAVLGGILVLILPWSPIYLRSIAGAVRGGLGTENRAYLWLLLWSLASLVPFLMFKVKFERYLMVAVPPAVLLLYAVPYGREVWKKAAWWSASVLYGAVGLGTVSFGFWFRIAPVWVSVLLLLLLGLFVVRTWMRSPLGPTAVVVGLFHMLLFGVFYPGLGVQEVPRELKEALGESTRPVYYFRGDNPGMLSMTLKTSVQKVAAEGGLRAVSGGGANVIVEERDEQEFLKASSGLFLGEQVEFTSFYSRVGWANFAREGATREDWSRAFDTRSLEGLKTRFRLYYVERRNDEEPEGGGGGR